MLYGVMINGIDTLEEYGLALLADLKIAQPKLKTNRISIPGGDGDLNLSYSPQGRPVYDCREISFRLFKAMGEAERDNLVSTMRNHWHGKEVNLILPNDAGHYWHGVLAIGDVSGFNEGVIPVSLLADPYKLKTSETTVSLSSPGSVTLQNERKPVAPEVTTDAEVTLAWDDTSVSISAGTHVIPQLILDAGSTVIDATGAANVSFTWREGSL